MAGHWSVESMAGKSLDQTRVVLLVCNHQAQGQDQAVLAGAITHLWTGAGCMKTLFNFCSAFGIFSTEMPNHFSSRKNRFSSLNVLLLFFRKGKMSGEIHLSAVNKWVSWHGIQAVFLHGTCHGCGMLWDRRAGGSCLCHHDLMFHLALPACMNQDFSSLPLRKAATHEGERGINCQDDNSFGKAIKAHLLCLVAFVKEHAK